MLVTVNAGAYAASLLTAFGVGAASGILIAAFCIVRFQHWREFKGRKA